MAAFGADKAIQLCKDDLALGDQTLASLKLFEEGKLPRKIFLNKLDNAVEGFFHNSSDFGPIVSHLALMIAWVMIIFSIVKTLIGIFISFLLARSIGRDYLALKRSEEKLQYTQKQNQLVLDHLPSFVFYKDDKNNILMANRAAAESCGITPEEMAGQHSKTFYPEMADKYYADDLEVFRSKSSKLGYYYKKVPKAS